MSDAIQLSADGPIDGRVVMTVEVRPNRRVCIQIFVPIRIVEDRPAASDDYDGLFLEPFAHLCEWVPEITMIEDR